MFFCSDLGLGAFHVLHAHEVATDRALQNGLVGLQLALVIGAVVAQYMSPG